MAALKTGPPKKKRLFNAIKKKARARHAIAQGSEQRAARNGRRLLFTKLQATRICAYNTHYVIAKDWLPSALRFDTPYQWRSIQVSTDGAGIIIAEVLFAHMSSQTMGVCLKGATRSAAPQKKRVHVLPTAR